jgi:hypothetical protein
MLAVTIGLATSTGANADEVDAKNLLKAMSDYMAAQTAISFDYDANFEIVTKDQQKLGLASSGTATLNRPDKIRATRSGGFVDAEMVFDGKTLTMVDKIGNQYAQIDAAGTIDQLIDTLREKHGLPLPAADLLLSDPYDILMADVIDVKDLGSGVIGGVECDHLAFRTAEVDWQIWIAQGDRPYPCRYVITTKNVELAPQYSIQVRAWRSGDEVAADDFGFGNATNAQKVELKDFTGAGEMPGHFMTGGAQ